MPRTRPHTDIRAVLELKEQGRTDREISTVTGVPVNTIRAWRNHGLPKSATRGLNTGDVCSRCGAESHRFECLPAETYAYLLGVYLGDGCLTPAKASWSLRIALDEAYPGIIESCCDAIEVLRGGHRPRPRIDHRDQHCVRVDSMWKRWICLFPQHAPGRKHARKIELVDWQRVIVDKAPGPFIRGLIHTDGWRGINRVHVKGKDYEYPRFQFSNRSEGHPAAVHRDLREAGRRLAPVDPLPRVRCAARFCRQPGLVRRPEAVGRRCGRRDSNPQGHKPTGT
jgi:hypothetical protein